MKKFQNIFLWISVTILFVVTIGIVNFYPLLSMKPIKSGKILDTGIYAINNKINNMFLIETYDGYIAIDSGSDAKSVALSLAQSKINPADIKYVFLTHTDYDHVASLNLYPNAQIYMSEDELQMIDGSTKRSTFKRNTLPPPLISTEITPLKDSQELIFGEQKIKCIKVPGHTMGSMAYLLDNQYLFTGDSLKVNDNIISLHPYTMDEQSGTNSIKQIKEFLKETQFVITAHYGFYYSNKLK